MTQPFLRGRFTWLAYLLLAFYSYYLNILGPITPFLKNELGLSYTVASLHFAAFAVGILLVGLFGHLLIDRIGRRRALWTGAVGIALGTVLLLAGRNPAITIAASFCMGLVGSLILAIVPSALADQYGETRAIAISEANVLGSFAGAVAPLLVGWFARSLLGWRMALGIFALAPLALWLFFAKTPTPRAAASGIADGRPVSRSPLPARYWVYWLDLVLVVSVEFCMIFWSADYLESGIGMAKADAALAVSLFLAAMIVGRFSVSRLVNGASSAKWVSISILTAAAGFLAYWQTTRIPIALAGLFVAGLGVAGLYPLILSLAIGAAGASSLQGSSRATLASGTAILLLPLVLGRLADSTGIRSAYAVVAALLAAALLTTLLATRLATRLAPHPRQAVQELTTDKHR
jgi:MFS family permease